MKVLLVHDYGTANGGAELQMLALRRLLRERGHDARLFSSRAQLTPSTVQADYDCFGSTTNLQVLTQTFNPSAYWNLRRALRDFQPDVVHARMFLWQLSPTILPLLRDLPSIYQAATYKAICPTGSKLKPSGECSDAPGDVCVRSGCITRKTWAALSWQQMLWLRWKDAFDRFLALSHEMRRRLEDGGLRPVEVVYNGVPERPPRGPLPDLPLVACASRLAPEKGLLTLLEAMRLVRDSVPRARLLLAGEGPMRAELERRAAELGLQSAVEFAGHLSREELERRFDAAWVQVAPSLWAEPFGNVALEAMMRGTAFVASRSGGFVESVADQETGLLTTPGDVEELASAMASLLNSRESAEKLGAAGRERALAHFSEQACAEGFLNCYERVIREFHGR